MIFISSLFLMSWRFFGVSFLIVLCSFLSVGCFVSLLIMCFLVVVIVSLGLIGVVFCEIIGSILMLFSWMFMVFLEMIFLLMNSIVLFLVVWLDVRLLSSGISGVVLLRKCRMVLVGKLIGL